MAGLERGGGGEASPGRVNHFHCNCVISLGTSRSFCEWPLKAEARGLFLIQPHAASEAPDSRTAVLSRLGRADGWRKGFVCVRVLACVRVCVCLKPNCLLSNPSARGTACTSPFQAG